MSLSEVFAATVGGSHSLASSNLHSLNQQLVEGTLYTF